MPSSYRRRPQELETEKGLRGLARDVENQRLVPKHIGVMLYLFTQRRSVAKNAGCFRRRLFVGLFVCLFVDVFVNTITSERVNTKWWNLGGRCTVQKSRPSSNVGVIALCNFVWIAIICHIATYLTIQSHSSGGARFPDLLALRCSENQRRLSGVTVLLSLLQMCYTVERRQFRTEECQVRLFWITAARRLLSTACWHLIAMSRLL